MTRRKLVMNFFKERDHLGNAKYKKVTLKVRPEATVIDSRDLVTGGDFYEVEEIFYNEEQEKPMITVDEGTNAKEKENSPDKGQIPDQNKVSHQEETLKPKEMVEPEIFLNPEAISESGEVTNPQKLLQSRADLNSKELLESVSIPNHKEVAKLDFISSKEGVPEVEFTPDKVVSQNSPKGWTQLWKPKTVSFLDQQLMDNYLNKYKKGKPFTPLPNLLGREPLNFFRNSPHHMYFDQRF